MTPRMAGKRRADRDVRGNGHKNISRSHSNPIFQLPPPQSVDAEQQVLASILKDPDAISVVIKTIDDAEHFYAGRHKLIFKAMLRLYDRGGPCDITTVAEELAKMDALDDAGGRIYLIELVEGLVSTANLKYYIDILLEKFRLRQLIDHSLKIASECYEFGTEVQSVAPLVQEIIDLVSHSPDSTIVTAGDIVPDILKELDEVNRGKAELGLKTHIEDLNHILCFRPGQLIIIAARPSEGKSALMLNFCEYISQHLDQKTLLFSLEMDAKEIFTRQLLGRARISSERFISNISIQDNRWADVLRAADELTRVGKRLLVCDLPKLTPIQIRGIAKEEDKKGRLGLVAIDYLTLVTPDNLKRSANREQDVANMTRSFKLLARELHLPVLLCAQLNRAVDKGEKRRKPRLSDLRESGAIEQDADIVIFIHHENEKMTGKSELIVAKQRGGKKGPAPVVWIPEYVRFEGASKRE